MAHPIKHLRTVLKHRHKVISHCRRAGIFWQGQRHDLSKFCPSEFFAGAKYFAGTHSPNENERREKGYSTAWMHHKGRNRHHFEYWTDVNPKTKRVEPVPMPVNYVAEMFCDRVAASKTYKGKAYKDSDPLEYFKNGESHRIIHPDTSALLESWLVILAERGEKAVFPVIKKAVKESKKKS